MSDNDRITLTVGERRFITTRQTLVEESIYFADLLSGCWDGSQEVDGSYFINSDPNLFDHILRYLRRSVLPIFYDKAKGHDYALYLALLQEAIYFDIPRLIEWLEKKQYHQAVKIQYETEEYEEAESICLKRETDTDLEWSPMVGIKKVYVCPRGIHVHRGKHSACGKDCAKAQGDADDIYDDEPFSKMVVVEKKILFDADICVNER